METIKYKMNWDAQDEIESISTLVDKANLLTGRLTIKELPELSGENYEFYKNEIALYADILFDYVGEASQRLKSLLEKTEVC